jgi:3-oxoadipate enol-lactonase
MPKVRVNDIEMYYEIHGKGMPLVHIGGLAGDARTWMRQSGT